MRRPESFEFSCSFHLFEITRFAGFSAALEKRFCAFHVLDIHIAPYFKGQLFQLMDWLSLAAFEYMRDRVALGSYQGSSGHRHSSYDRRDSVPFVEPVIGWPATGRIANVPLADDCGGIARIGENVSQRPLPLHEP